MGLFSKKTPANTPVNNGPYQDSSTNFIYNLLFCDDLNLYVQNTKEPHIYPFDILFADDSSISDLQRVIDDPGADPRVKVLAYNKQLAAGHKPANKELLAVIVEIGLDDGLVVLASFHDGTARYINHTGNVLVWETTDDTNANAITRQLFNDSVKIVNQIGPWDKPRRPAPTRGLMRITFLVSDGLYFGEGPMDVLFNDPLASPALTSATQLMQYITSMS
ncbi:MAG: hypothetical protein J7621_26870 [Niastella sp.]|nr:hypothetical protein [Niastella sp.]